MMMKLAGLLVVAKKVAKAIEQVFPCEKVGVVVLGSRSSSCAYSS
jgi:hypothetical protein